MNAHVARGAILITRVCHIVGSRRKPDSAAQAAEIAAAVVTLQAQGKHDRAQEEPRIRRSVRRVTCLAAVHAGTQMFEDKGAALIRMTFETRFFIRHSLLDVAGN